jgi:hypothetical protein
VSGFSQHYRYENEHGVRCDPGIHVLGQYGRLAADRVAEMRRLAPEPIVMELQRVVAVQAERERVAGFELKKLSKPVIFTPSHRGVAPGRFAQLSKSGAGLLDDFYAGGQEGWRQARDQDIYDALLTMISTMALGGEGDAAGYLYRGESGVGGTRGWDPDETAAEMPLDRTTHPRAGFLSRVVLPLSRLTNYLLIVRRGGNIALEDVPIS